MLWLHLVVSARTEEVMYCTIMPMHVTDDSNDVACWRCCWALVQKFSSAGPGLRTNKKALNRGPSVRLHSQTAPPLYTTENKGARAQAI